MATVGAEAALEPLGPGLSVSEIRHELAEIGLEPPDELLVWYGWRNAGRTMLTPGVEPISLRDGIARYQSETLGDEPWEWRPGWLPISHERPCIVVDCNGAATDPAPIMIYDSWDGGFSTSYPGAGPFASLCIPVSWWIEALQDGIYTWDQPRGAWADVRADAIAPERRGMV